ncbi:MAG: hypothetical protein JSW14_00355 [Candidatus Bathyarchaeum sp.]|nr:MAG: hypothetical protein JSW14_00355 [Candidatus Bathyarchaeum sp.]
MSFPEKRRTISRSFRIDEEWMEALHEEAEREGISVNALMNKILQQYSRNYRHAGRYGVVILTRPTFASIIRSCSNEALTETAKASGSTRTKDALRTLGIPSTHDSLVAFIRDNLGEYAGWFKFNHHITENKEMLHLRHVFGNKWSIFIAEAISTMFEFILNKKVTTEISNFTATITIDR